MKIFKYNYSILYLPTPTNISFLWNMGFLLGMCLILQIISGILLSMNYSSTLMQAFDSVIHIMRDLESGWLMRYIHLNGASLFFILLYLHLGRGIYFMSSRKLPTVWLSGVIILLLSMMIAFMGYVLPWGQMSYWGATVISSMLTSIPYVGHSLIMWIWGDFSVSGPFLSRMYSLHFLLPMILTVVIGVHLLILHFTGSSNPSGLSSNFNKKKFLPYFFLKDVLSLFLPLIFLIYLICINPFIMGDPENFIYASISSTPEHIKPEWYFLFAYAILRCTPSKIGGVVMMFMSILIILILMIKVKKPYYTLKFIPHKKILCYSFFFMAFSLTIMGGKSVNDTTMLFTQLMTFFYFMFCIFLL